MKKDAYYFPHFSNARSDRKILRVRKELGLEGYGIYFMVLEVLRDQTKFRYPLTDIDLLAHEFQTSEQKVRTVICNYQLFEVDESENFFSPKLDFYLQPYIEKSKRARLAAQKRWDKVNNDNNLDANAKQMQSKCNAKRVKESKVNESKVKEIKELWDFFASSYGLNCINSITKSRQSKLNARFKEPNFDFIKILKEAETQPFLHGKNNNGWKITFDWIIQNETNYTKILERNYADSKNSDFASFLNELD